MIDNRALGGTMRRLAAPARAARRTFERRNRMGILWEIVQTGLMYGQKRSSDSVEDRVKFLEDQVAATQNTLRNLVRKLEEINKADIDGDGKVG
jgi:bisphosphoglycerate-dependent phosphoglycerate mutase